VVPFDPTGDSQYLIHWKKHSAPSFAGLSGAVPWPLIDEDPLRFGQLISLVKDLIAPVNPAYGDIQNMKHPRWDTPFNLQKRLPDVPWLSIYGEPYIRLFGEDKILSAPFYKVERLASGHYWLQATESILDPVPESVRLAISKHLGEASFMAWPKWRYKEGKAPKFDFSKVVA